MAGTHIEFRNRYHHSTLVRGEVIRAGVPDHVLVRPDYAILAGLDWRYQVHEDDIVRVLDTMPELEAAFEYALSEAGAVEVKDFRGL